MRKLQTLMIQDEIIKPTVFYILFY